MSGRTEAPSGAWIAAALFALVACADSTEPVDATDVADAADVASSDASDASDVADAPSDVVVEDAADTTPTPDVASDGDVAEEASDVIDEVPLPADPLADPQGPRCRLAHVFMDRILPEHESLLVQARAGAAQLYALSAEDLISA